MSCLTFNKEFLTKCKNGKPGISEVWLINLENLDTVTLSGTSDEVSSITVTTYDGGVTPPPYSSGAAFKIAVNRESSTVEDEAVINVQNGTSIHKPMLKLKIAGMTQDVATAFHQLMEAPVVAIAKSVDGTYWLIGKDNGLDLESGSKLQFGTASTDFAGADLTFSGLEPNRILPIDSAFDVTTLQVQI